MLISTFGQSGINSLPFDATTLDNATEPYGPDESSSKEKEDVDMFTAPFARIAVAAGDPVVRPAISVSPAGGTYVGGTSVTLTATGDNTPIQIHYTLDGTAPTLTSPSIVSGSSINVTANNTVLKAVAVDAEGTFSHVATHTYITEEPAAASGITVSFLKPLDWGSAAVSIWAWTAGDSNLFSAWPGVAMTEKADGWYSYTFEESITSVSVIFSKAGNPQSVDITGITSNTCYETDGTTGSEFNVKVVPCPIVTSIKEHQTAESLVVYPNPATDAISIKHLSESIKNVAVLSIDGKVVKVVENYSENERITLSGLPNGVYMLKVTANDETISFVKFVKR